MELDFDTANFSQFKVTILNLKAKLGIGEAIISIIAFEPGVSWLFARLNPSKERLKSLIQSIGYILKHLGIDTAETGAFRFKLRDTLALLEIRQTFLLLFPAITAIFQELVIQPATLIKLYLKEFSLMLSGIQTVFKALSHQGIVYLKNTEVVNTKTGGLAHSSPALKCGAF